MKCLFVIFIGILSFNSFAQNSLWTINQSDGNLTQVRKYDFNGSYNFSWTSDKSNYEDFVIGDSDNDGIDEFIIIDSEKFYVYESSVDTPTAVALPSQHSIGNIIIADADNDGNNEIVIQHQLNGGLLIFKYISGSYNLEHQISNSMVWWADVGDADNDGLNEIIIGKINSISIYGYDSLSVNFTLKYNIPSQGWNDMVIAGDVDNDGLNELISGGNFSAVRIWEFNGTGFLQIGAQSVIGYSQGVNVGDSDNDGNNELIVGAAEISGSRLVYVYEFTNGNFNLEWSNPINIIVGIAGVEIGDSDNDNKNEIAFFSELGQATIFKYDSSISSYTTHFEIPGCLNVMIDRSINLANPNPKIIVDSVETQSIGSEFNIVMEVTNIGISVDSFIGTLSTIDPSINLIQNNSTFPPLEFNESGDNSDNPFVFSLTSPPNGGTIPFSIVFSIDGDTVGTSAFEIINPYNQFVEISDIVGFTPLSWDVIDLFFTDINNDSYPDIFLNPEYNGSRTLFVGNESQSFQSEALGGPFRYCYNNGYTDISNDSYIDIYESNYLGTSWGGNLLFLNDASSFIDISNTSGTNYVGESQGIVSFDYNNDGYLDLFLSNGIGGVENDLLFENNGDSTYTDVSNLVGINYQANGQHVVTGDINNDGLMDLYVVNFDNPNILLVASVNSPDSQVTYTDISNQAGVNISGRFYAADFGDFNNDGWLDLITTGRDSSNIFINLGNNSFQNISSSAGFDNFKGMDLALLDYNQDSFLDIFFAGSFRSPSSNNVLLKNNGDLTFSDETVIAGLDVESIGHCAMADYNLDGSPDIALAGQGYSPTSQLYHNNGANKNWLSIKLRGVESNSLGIGARINLWAAGVYQIREVNSNLGNDVVANFGLSRATTIDSITINWPSGITQHLYNISSNQLLNVEELNVTWVDQNFTEGSFPVNYALFHNYPNPFNPATKISYQIPHEGVVKLVVYDATGREVRTLVNEFKTKGRYEAVFIATDLASGVYIYKLKVNDFVQTRKMMLLK